MKERNCWLATVTDCFWWWRLTLWVVKKRVAMRKGVAVINWYSTIPERRTAKQGHLDAAIPTVALSLSLSLSVTDDEDCERGSQQECQTLL